MEAVNTQGRITSLQWLNNTVFDRWRKTRPGPHVGGHLRVPLYTAYRPPKFSIASRTNIIKGQIPKHIEWIHSSRILNDICRLFF